MGRADNHYRLRVLSVAFLSSRRSSKIQIAALARIFFLIAVQVAEQIPLRRNDSSSV